MKVKNFWIKLKKPIYALAPMAEVGDSAFRQICKNFGADVVYSEMASVSALVYNPKKTLEMLRFNEIEMPYVIQLFGSNPKHFVKATKLLTGKRQIPKLPITNYKLPQGIDINFGCPVKKVLKQGAGAALMANLKLAREVIKSVIGSTNLPVSIKPRSCVEALHAMPVQIDVLKFLDYINDLNIKAVMIHGRTLAQGHSGPVDTETIKKARNYFSGIILANGGVYSYDDAVNILNKTKADGIGIAQGALGKPWIFKAVRTGQSVIRAPKAIFKIALKHAQLAQKLKGRQGIIEMRKHLCWYVAGLPGASEMRSKLVKVVSIKDISGIFNKYMS